MIFYAGVNFFLAAINVYFGLKGDRKLQVQVGHLHSRN